MFAANRFTGEPRVRVPGGGHRQPGGRRDRDARRRTAVYEAAHSRHGRRTSSRSCGAATRWPRPTRAAGCSRQSPRSLVGLHLHRQADLPPRAHGEPQGRSCGGAIADALAPFDRKQVEVSDHRPERQGGAPAAGRPVDEFGSALASLRAAARRGARALRHPRRQRRRRGDGQLRGPGIPQAGVRGRSCSPRRASSCRAARPSPPITARYYFGQPVANGVVKYVVHKQPYYSPLRWSDEGEDGAGRELVVRRRGGRARAPRGWTTRGWRRSASRSTADEERARLLGAHRGARHRRQQPRGVGQHDRPRHVRPLHAGGADRQLRVSAGEPGHRVASGRSTTRAPSQPNVPVNVALERLTYDQGRWDKPRATPISQRHRDDRRRRARLVDRDASEGAGNYRFRVDAAVRRPPRHRRCAACGCTGPAAGTGWRGGSVARADRRQEDATSPARPRDSRSRATPRRPPCSSPRRPGRCPGATSSGPAGRDVRGADRRRLTSATCTSTWRS